jgi:hypothetical protein
MGPGVELYRRPELRATLRPLRRPACPADPERGTHSRNCVTVVSDGLRGRRPTSSKTCRRLTPVYKFTVTSVTSVTSPIFVDENHYGRATVEKLEGSVSVCPLK